MSNLLFPSSWSVVVLLNLRDMQKFLFSMIIALFCSCGDAQSVSSNGFSKHFPGDRPKEQPCGVIFYIATRRYPNRVMVRSGELENIFERTDLDLRRKTIFIVHGIRSSANEEWVRDLQNALLDWNDLNIISVDWSALGGPGVSWRWVEKAKLVPGQIADFIESISSRSTFSNEATNSIYLIGHSMGAHICGVSANLVILRNVPWMIERISGLDPAIIDVGGHTLPHRLDKSQAPYVDVYHTSMLGIFRPLGHSDFYLNGGTNQPGCGSKIECDHARAHGYFIESVKSKTRDDRCIFPIYRWKLPRNLRHPGPPGSPGEVGEKDKTCSEVGINSDKYSCNGTFFVRTTAKKPYCYFEVE